MLFLDNRGRECDWLALTVLGVAGASFGPSLIYSWHEACGITSKTLSEVLRCECLEGQLME
jgi:hypothetical protein